jgi:hypothetical protein
MAAKLTKALFGTIVDELAGSTTSSAALNLARAIQDKVRAGDLNSAARIIAGTGQGNFAGALTAAEKKALRPYVEQFRPTFIPDDVRGEARKVLSAELKDYVDAQAKVQLASPLVLTPKTMPQLQMARGFVPVTGQNLNAPGFGIREWEAMTPKQRQRYIDEGANNLIAGYNLDPQAAALYSMFYPRIREQLAATGLPLDRIGGAWATTSAQASPDRNAQILMSVMRDPTGKATNLNDQKLTLEYLAGLADETQEPLGRGKRANFLVNSIDPDNPDALTADTRYMQNLLGVLNNYGITTGTTGLFTPRGRQYGEIYVEPGMEAARRMGLIPNRLQAGSWGNWRNIMSGLETDLSGDLLAPIAGFADEYNPQRYVDALEILRNTSKEQWQDAPSALSPMREEI